MRDVLRWNCIHMNIHPREQMVMVAERDVDRSVGDALSRYDDLTTAETLRILTAVLSERIGWIARRAIRVERHGDPNEPGGLL
jgi:hypothetical protein